MYDHPNRQPVRFSPSPFSSFTRKTLRRSFENSSIQQKEVEKRKTRCNFIDSGIFCTFGIQPVRGVKDVRIKNAEYFKERRERVLERQRDASLSNTNFVLSRV